MSLIDYKISVNDKTVTLEISKQDAAITKHIKSREVSFNKIRLLSCSCVEISSKTCVYLLGSSKVSSSKKDNYEFKSASEAFEFAANLTKAIDELSATVANLSEKKLEEKKAVGSEFEYKVSVDGRTVTFEVLKQSDKIRSYFYAAKTIDGLTLESSGTVEIRSLTKIYIAGVSTSFDPPRNNKSTYTCSSNAEALSFAAKITKAIDTAQKTWPDVFGVKSAAIKLTRTFKRGVFYIDPTDGEIVVGVGSDRIKRGVKEASCTLPLAPIGTADKVIELFGSAALTPSKAKKKFGELNKSTKTLPWR